MSKKLIKPDQPVPLNLTAAEQKLLLDDLLLLDEEYEQAIRATPPGKPVMLTLADLDDFCGYVAAEANHAKDKRIEEKRDAIFEKMQDVLAKYGEEE